MNIIDQNTSYTGEMQQLNGVVVGVVTDNQDPEKLGRVKVKFPWRDNGDSSYWARIASLMAGKNRGTLFIPEVDDEVLVTFDHGDIHHPYVLGALWNGNDPLPEGNHDGKNNIRKIKSRSGHEIIFNDDAEGKQEKVEILSKAGHRISLDDSNGKEKIECIDKSGNAIVIDSVENSISLKGSVQVTIESETIEIKGKMVTVDATGELTLKGSLVRIN